MKLISIIFILGLLISVQGQYTLNGQQTDSCPFYTYIDGNQCVDTYQRSLPNPTVLSEALFKQYFELTDFDLTGWTKGNRDTQSRFISKCGDRSIYGGFQQIPGSDLVRSISRTFTNIPEHYQLSVKFQFYFIDSWDDETMSVYVDNKVVYSHRFNEKGLERKQICGSTNSRWTEYIENVSIEVTHTAPTANIRIQWEVDQTSTDESGGIREIQIISVGYPTYFLNGKTTNYCPFYTTLDTNNVCVDNYVESLELPQILSEALYDRYFTTPDQLTQQGWQIGNIQANERYTSVCGDKSLYGGFGVLVAGGRTKHLTAEYNDLPQHSKMMIKFNFYFVDSWDNENLVVYVDDIEVSRYTHQHNAPGTVTTCGGSWKDFQKTFEIPVDHTSQRAKIRIEWTLSSEPDDESGGLREIQVVIARNPTFDLNGQQVDHCPPFTTLNQDDKVCEDTFFQKSREPQLLTQSLVDRYFSFDSLDSTTWKIQPSGGVNRYISICDEKNIFGGHSAYPSSKGVKSITASFNDIDLHDYLQIRFQFYFLDSWDQEVLQVYVDGVQVLGKTHVWSDERKYHICGNNKWQDWSETIDLQVEHSSRNAEIRIEWSLDQESVDESGGIRDIQIFAYKTPYYNLNGNNVTKCPFYAPLNEVTLTCVDPLVESLSKPIIINEALTNKSFSGDKLQEQGWTSALTGTQSTSVCDGIRVFGGYKTFPGFPSSSNSITGSFSRIPKHNSVVIRFLFYYYDSWDHQKLTVYADDQVVFEYVHQFQHDGTKFICGNPSYQDLIKPYEIEIPHSAKDLTVKIEWILDQDPEDESGGIREIQILGKGTQDIPKCVTLYTECDFEGEAISACEDDPNLDNRQIKSIFIPENVKQITLYKDVDFAGQTQVFDASQQCLEGINYQFLSQINRIKISNKKTHHKTQHLKKNSHKQN